MDQPYDGRRAARHRLIGDQDVLRLALQSLTDERLERQAAKHMRLAPPVASKFSTTLRPESPRNLAAVVRAVPYAYECCELAPHQAAEAEPVLPKLLAPRCLAGPLSPPANPPARDADKMTSVGPNGNSIALNVIAQFLFFVCKNKNY